MVRKITEKISQLCQNPHPSQCRSHPCKMRGDVAFVAVKIKEVYACQHVYHVGLSLTAVEQPTCETKSVQILVQNKIYM